MARRCLYYPFIHFRDEAWLKLSALYWDDVSRIVPRSYTPRDSKEIRILEDAGVLCRVDPGAYEGSVSQLFGVLLARHERKLVARYDVAQRESWPVNLERFGVAGRARSRSLAFIHVSKLEPALVEQLLSLRLALPSHDRRWLGMHPAIVSAYMIALAGEIGRRRGLSPSCDNAMHLSGVTSCSAEDLARSLVAEVDLGKRRRHDAPTTTERVAFVTLRTVLPEHLERVPAKRIVLLRKQHAGARHAFHAYVDGLQKELAATRISDTEALDQHIRLEYQKRVEPELLELRRGLRSVGVGCVLGSFGLAVTLPLGSLLAAAPSVLAVAAASAGAGVGVAALAQKQRDAARDLLRPTPASFLFLTEGLRPRSLQKRLTESIRRFSLGV